jgi:Holliday junction resolvase
MSERQLQDAVIELAQWKGWKVMHIYDSRRMTGQGWPDLFMVRGPQCLAVELKSAKGRVSVEQDEWLELLNNAGVMTFCWRPEHWQSGQIERVLC